MNMIVNVDITPQEIWRLKGLPAIQGPLSKNDTAASNKKRAK
jgi:hypothetical protein